MQTTERIDCAKYVGTNMDFVTLGARASEDKLSLARATCAGCPALFDCLAYLQHQEVWGFAAGMTVDRRETWRARDDHDVQDTTIVDVSEAAELTGPIVDDLTVVHGKTLTPEAVAVVIRMTEAGFTAEEIVTRLGKPEITRRTVQHIRHKYATTGITARRKERASRQALAAAS